ncbi:alginate O-acetyltransferase AlgX-related protein [Pseudomonas fluorescens]
MKNKIAVFFISAFLILMISPVFNLATRLPGHTDENVKWWELSFLYNVDFAMPLLGSLYSMVGVSIDPGEVILGKDGWLFLGDDYIKSISVKRAGMTPQEATTIEKVADTQAKWNKWYKQHGVKQYRVLIGPDKDSIYPEFLPAWAAHSANPVTAQLLKIAPQGVYVDAFTPLLAAKDKNPPLYFKTDTHWNNLGAWIAFTALADNLRKAEPKLVWPDPASGKVASIVPQGGGDLAKFQRVQNSTRDQKVVLSFDEKYKIPVERYDYDSGKLLGTNQNLPSEPPHHAQLFVSKDALNDKKVLWLRDSYGIAMSPFMAATFSNVVQVHHDALDSDSLIKLVERFKPDYVLYSVVERGSRIGLFVSPPELYAMSSDAAEFVPSAKGTVSLINDVKTTKTAGRYDITGPDPFIVFTMAPQATGSMSHQLTFDAECFNPAEKLTPVQIFWSTPTEGFKESSSARFFINQGTTSVDLSGAPGWPTTEQIVNVRFDIDSTTACSGFSLKNLATGVNADAVKKK